MSLGCWSIGRSLKVTTRVPKQTIKKKCPFHELIRIGRVSEVQISRESSKPHRLGFLSHPEGVEAMTGFKSDNRSDGVEKSE